MSIPQSIPHLHVSHFCLKICTYAGCASLALLYAASQAQAAEQLQNRESSLEQQNTQLHKLVEQQQLQIDALRLRLDALEKGPSLARNNSSPHPAIMSESSGSNRNESTQKIRLSGEVAFAFFRSGADGQYPNSEFRVDEAKIFIEAQVARNTFLVGGLELTTREANDEYFHVGELYADVEQVLRVDRDAVLNLRVGRFAIPFGEEYQTRNPLSNCLISHSVTDLWGIDEGIMLYGTRGRINYNLAVQNGGHKTLRDFNSDKSVTARLSIDPTPRVHLSASAMRTGSINATDDRFSELWIANGFFRALSPGNNTTTFSADLAEIDVSWRWPTGTVKGSAGWISFDDNSTTTDNSRRIDYYSLEASQQIFGDFSGAIRVSEIHVPNGFPLGGQGNTGTYFFSPGAPLTTDLRRLSIGLFYKFSRPLILKAEYSWETRHQSIGPAKNDADLLSTQLVLSF